MEQQLKKYRQWQKENPEWELICDIDNQDALYVQWHELPKAERMSWIGMYREDPRAVFEEFGTKRCKVSNMVLSPDLTLHKIIDWPEGFCMAVFKTDRINHI